MTIDLNCKSCGRPVADHHGLEKTCEMLGNAIATMNSLKTHPRKNEGQPIDLKKIKVSIVTPNDEEPFGDKWDCDNVDVSYSDTSIVVESQDLNFRLEHLDMYSKAAQNLKSDSWGGGMSMKEWITYWLDPNTAKKDGLGLKDYEDDLKIAAMKLKHFYSVAYPQEQ